MKVNFKAFEIQTSFTGNRQKVDIAETLGNLMMFNGSVLLDIGFEDLAKEIYYSKGEVEIPLRYLDPIKEVVKTSNFLASIKRAIINIKKDGE